MIARYFFADGPGGWNYIRARWNPEREVVVLLDYDGTVVPIRRLPPLAVLTPATKKVLQTLSGRQRITVGLITGRDLGDIRKIVGLKHLLYAANHGFQIWIDQKTWVPPRAESFIPALARIRRALEDSLAATPGVQVENKTLTLSIHYRNIRRDLVPQVKRTVAAILQPYRDMFTLSHGKMVIEIRPNIRWDKGLAALHLLKALALPEKPLVFYIGDDRTDEDAFRRLRSRAITIKVGKSYSTGAKYFVRNTMEVQRILKQIAAVNIEETRA